MGGICGIAGAPSWKGIDFRAPAVRQCARAGTVQQSALKNGEGHKE
jgi:hypothetical protein